MAGLNVCKILLVLGALTHHGFGVTLDLTIFPTETSQLLSEDVYISCRPGTSLQAKTIVLIKIIKSGDYSALASVNQTDEVYTTSGIKAIGHIDDSALLESFLTITLEDPTYEQSGSYECELTYLDVKGQSKVAKTSGDVKVIKPDIVSVDGVVDDLREEIETNSQNFESVTKELHKTKAELQNQTSYISSQAKVIKNLEKKIETNAQDLVSYTSSQAKVTKDLEKKVEANDHNFESVTKLLIAVTQKLQETKAKLQKREKMECPNELWTRVDDNVCFRGYLTRVTGKKANETCRKEGGNLVSIHSKFHADMAHRVALSVGIKRCFWIGLNDIAEEGKWMFDDGTSMSTTYTNWYKGEPNNWQNEDCVVQWMQYGVWVDYSCSIRKISFVCQASTRPVYVW